MNRSVIAILVAVTMALMTFPGQVTAHESTAADLNDVAYDQVWPLLGPGGVTDREEVKNGLKTLGLHAQENGGDKVLGSCTHHDPGIQDVDDPFNTNDQCTWSANDDDGAVHEMKFYQCNGSIDHASTEQAEITIESPIAFKHSDLENGIFEATGSFFTPVQFSGNPAHVDEIEQVWFGFAHTFAWPLSSSLCQDPFPIPGSYYEFYRGDTDGSDGWEIPVNTLLVPDAPYGAILRVMDASGNTLAASFVYSNVNNYLNDAEWQPGTPTTCNQGGTGGTLCPYHDVTPPRGTVFDQDVHPAAFPRSDDIDNTDGTTASGNACNQGVALEYGEPLADDGSGSPAVEVTDGSGGGVNYYTYNPPDRDVDSAPLTTTARDNWGPGICIPFPPSTVVVKAWDQSGNVGTQTIT